MKIKEKIKAHWEKTKNWCSDHADAIAGTLAVVGTVAIGVGSFLLGYAVGEVDTDEKYNVLLPDLGDTRKWCIDKNEDGVCGLIINAPNSRLRTKDGKRSWSNPNNCIGMVIDPETIDEIRADYDKINS